MPDESDSGNASADQPAPKIEKINFSKGRFREISPRDAWLPGLIEVVFKDPTRSGVRSWNFADEKAREEFSEAWPEGLRKALSANGLIAWQPSFPLQYPWTAKQSTEAATERYRASGHDKFVTFRFAAEAETRLIADKLRELPEIEQAVAVPRIGAPSGPMEEPLVGTSDQPDPICNDGDCVYTQWYIFRCNVDKAWEKKNAAGAGISGKGVVIADIDWGFNTNHQDLIARVARTQNVFQNSSNPTSVANGNRLHHGTAVLGIAGAEVNARGIAGIAFGADLWAIQAGLDNIENHSLWVAGVDYVRSQTTAARKVIILEVETAIGGNIEMVPTIAHEIRLAIAEQIVVCVPAGNGLRDAGIGDDDHPIPDTGSILVGATNFDAQANIRGVSNFGSRVVVYAPGDPTMDVTCGVTDDRYIAAFGGTSSAVAKVAGVAALILERNPLITHGQVRDILARSQIVVVDDQNDPVGVLLDADQAVFDARHAWWESLWRTIERIISKARRNQDNARRLRPLAKKRPYLN